IANSLADRLYFLQQPLASLRDLQRALSPGSQAHGLQIDMGSIVQPALAFLTPAVGELVVFFATVFFLLISHEQLRRYFVLFFAQQESRLQALRILNDVEESLTHYVGIVTLINIVLGGVTACAAFLIGLPNPIVWGVLAFAF